VLRFAGLGGSRELVFIRWISRLETQHVNVRDKIRGVIEDEPSECHEVRRKFGELSLCLPTLPLLRKSELNGCIINLRLQQGHVIKIKNKI